MGGIFTGNETYWIALAVGLPLLITVASIAGASGARKQKAAGVPVTRPGIVHDPGDATEGRCRRRCSIRCRRRSRRPGWC